MAVVLTTPRFREVFMPREGLTFRWVGHDDSVWNLTSGEQGVVLQKGAIGFGRPEWDHALQRSPALHGALWRGARANPRKLLLPLVIYSEEGEDGWLELSQQFWQTMRPDRPGRLEVQQPDGTVRHLVARFVSDGEAAVNHDPILESWEGHVVEMLAEGPFWRGDAVTRTFRNGSAEDFFAEDDPGVIVVSEMSTTANSTIPNLGDHPAYLRWRVTGPMTELLVGVGDRHVHVPFAIPEGSELIVDTRPTVQAAWLDGEEVTRDLGGETRFAPVPAGENPKLHVSFLGSGEVAATLTPLHDAAY